MKDDCFFDKDSIRGTQVFDIIPYDTVLLKKRQNRTNFSSRSKFIKKKLAEGTLKCTLKK